MSKLTERRKLYDIPAAPYLPLGKNILVFRLPSETVTASGLLIVEDAQEPKPMGVIIAAGLGALDVLDSHLVEIGDIVWFGRFAGWEKEVQRDPGGKGKRILQMKVEDVLGSVDAIERSKDYEILLNEEENHIYVKKGAKKNVA